MSQVVHILRKDLRHLRWLVALWGVILVARVSLTAVGAATAGDTFAAAIVFRELSGLLSVLQTLMLALLVARLVHDEPLVGWDAFWVTRPYSRRALATAKLLFGATVLVLAPLAAELVTMAIFSAGPSAQLVAAPSFLSSQLTWSLSLFIVAVLTPSLAGFVLATIGAVVGLAVATLLMLSLAIALGAVQTSDVDASILADPTGSVVSTILFIVSSLAVVIYQYRHRRWRMAAGFAGLALVANVLVPAYWPWPFLRPVPPDPGEWSRNVEATPATIDPRMALDSTFQETFDTGAPPRRRIHAFVQLAGMPDEFAAQRVRVSGSLTLPDGTTLQSRQMDSFSRSAGTTVGLAPANTKTPAHAALGDVQVLNDVAERSEEWPVLLSLTPEQHARHKGQSGRFNGTLDFLLFRTRIAGTLPLRAGSALDDRLSRIELVRARPVEGGYKLVVRYWRALPMTSAVGFPGYEFFLRNRRERSAVTLGRETSWSGDFAGTSLGARAVARALPGFSFGSAPAGFVVQTEALEFPERMRGGVVGVAKLEPSWFSDAELVVLETVYAGTVTRSVRLDDFRIPVD